MHPVVARHRAVRRLGFDRIAVGRHEHRSHQAERSVALGHRIGLHVAVVVLARPDVLARPLEATRDHVVDQPMFVGAAERIEPALELFIENPLEDLHEAAVVRFEDRVLGR